jgi:ribonuclease BN (tRNA processing enzyme)
MELPDAATEVLAERLFRNGGRVLVAGPMGAGKSTLAIALVAALDGSCRVISADPGQPLFGPPGAVSLGLWTGDRWEVERTEGLGTLDALRYRMPLADAVRRLAPGSGALLVDGPGVHRGLAAAELLVGLVRVAGLQAAVWVAPETDPGAVLPDLRACGARVERLRASPEAIRRSPTERVQLRSASWDRAMQGAEEVRLPLDGLALTGAPPPPDHLEAWVGRQAVLLDECGDTVTLGEVVAREPAALLVRAPPFPMDAVAAVAVRDAQRDGSGLLRTAPRLLPQPRQPLPDLTGPLPLPGVPARATSLEGVLVGGLFGDPLLHLRHTGTGRSLLLDLGQHPDLPARVAHSVSHVFVSHAHMDHFGGFPWLLRYRVGYPDTVTLVGPPGLSERVAGFVAGFTWDRIGDNGPRFRVGEVHGDALRWWAIQAGIPARRPDGEEALVDGIVHRADDLVVRTAVMDHGIPVLAWSVEESPRLAVRPEVLREMGVPAGPWLGRLKRLLAEGELGAVVQLPDGSEEQAGELGHRLTLQVPGRHLAYATDIADTLENRETLVRLARGADLLVCEATFLKADAARARETGHLTTRACAEIAAAAEVGLLVPFHFSHRYSEEPGSLIQELRATFSRVWAPAPW